MAASWLKWIDLVKVLAPMIIGLINPKLAPVAVAISDGIAQAEQINGATGPDKLKYVLATANDAAVAVNTTMGKTILDPSELNTAVTDAVNTTVAVINLVHPTAVVNSVK